jgi:Raf kinase inhibitor-like YbhB/YbcL family protein
MADTSLWAVETSMTLRLTSSAFADGGAIPSKFTCEGEDISPPLVWTGVPDKTNSLVLIVDDPDAPDPKAPRMTWVHWVLYDLPPSARKLAEAVSAGGLPPGTKVGLNDWKKSQYGGPCPPIGRHRYIHKLYALDIQLSELRSPTKTEVERAMKGHILAETRLIGTYQKGR